MENAGRLRVCTYRSTRFTASRNENTPMENTPTANSGMSVTTASSYDPRDSVRVSKMRVATHSCIVAQSEAAVDIVRHPR